MPSGRRVVIIGAGVGGLALACRLAHAGYRVTLLEKTSKVGGRAGQLVLRDGSGAPFVFDTGPTLLLMPEVYRDFFAALGRRQEDYVSLSPLKTNYRIFFDQPDGISSLDCTTDRARMTAQLEAMEPGAAEAYQRLLAKGVDMYNVSRGRFVGRNFLSALEFFSPSNLGLLVKTRALRKLYPFVASHFQDERLRRALTFQSMYLGISPFDAPAVYALLPATELAHGIWFPREGGIYGLVEGMARLAAELGVETVANSEVRKVLASGGRATGVELVSGERIDADHVVVNADLTQAWRDILPGKAPRRVSRMRLTSSGYMMYLGVKGDLPQLEHHNVFFGAAYRETFDDIFTRKQVPADPAFYVACPAKSDPALAPRGCQAVYVLVPVPHLAPGQDWAAAIPRLRAAVFSRLARCGVEDLESRVVVDADRDPAAWKRIYNLDAGSGFGLSHGITQVGWFRPANKHPSIKGLYFTGASTQPGTGIPMVMLSAMLTAERVLLDDGRIAKRVHENGFSNYVTK